MKSAGSAFANTSLQLSFLEWLKLLFGKEIICRDVSIVLALWHMPDNGCPCEICTRAFQGRRDRGKKPL